MMQHNKKYPHRRLARVAAISLWLAACWSSYRDESDAPYGPGDAPDDPGPDARDDASPGEDSAPGDDIGPGEDGPPPTDEGVGPGDDGGDSSATCGNGLVEPGETCDEEGVSTCGAECPVSGVRSCLDCRWTPCVHPDERCDGVDEDCDGVCDDGFACCAGTTGDCLTACGGPGTRTCDDGCSWGPCLPPPAEICNDADDDCDGATDEGLGCTTAPPAAARDFYDVWGSGPDDVYAVGEGPTIRWNGDAWTLAPGGAGRGLSEVDGTGPNDVWTAGGTGEVNGWNGTAWTSLRLPADTAVRGLWVAEPGRPWVLAGTGEAVVHRWTGDAWAPLIIPAGDTLLALWGTSPTDAWAAGNRGLVWHWDGSSWIRTEVPTTLFFQNGTSMGPNDVLLVGYAGFSPEAGLIAWDGFNWTLPFYHADGRLHGIWADPDGTTWLVGNGHALRGDRTTWADVAIHPGADLRAVWGTPGGDVWAVGMGTTLLRFRR